MGKTIVIKERLNELNGHCLASLVGHLVTALEDFGYAYDMEDEVNEAIVEILEAHNIDWDVEDNEL